MPQQLGTGHDIRKVAKMVGCGSGMVERREGDCQCLKPSSIAGASAPICQRKQMVLDTVSGRLKMTVESQLSTARDEGNF